MLSIRQIKTKSKKGISLTELLVSIAILAIVATPFLATFLSAAKNNSMSGDILNASALAQKVMEDIKSRPGFLLSESEYFKSQGSNVYRYYPLEPPGLSIKIKYRIGIEQEGVLPEGSQPYNPFGGISYNMKYDVYRDEVELGGSRYDLDSAEYFLEISGALGSYSYRFYDDQSSFLDIGNVNAGENLNIRINLDQQRDASAEEFYLSVDLDDGLDKEVYFYIFDEKSTAPGVKLMNLGSKAFYEYHNLSSRSIEDYSNVLYKIQVVAEKDGEEITRLNSFVKK